MTSKQRIARQLMVAAVAFMRQIRLDLRRRSTGYEVRVQSVVCGFLNPIDTEILNGRLYVLEFGGAGTVWEIKPPAAEPAGRRTCANVPR
jgi:hypothetical protein